MQPERPVNGGGDLATVGEKEWAHPSGDDVGRTRGLSETSAVDWVLWGGKGGRQGGA